jgi:hypothetical protein
MLAASLAWACVVAFWAVRTWTDSLTPARVFVDMWAGLSGWTWIGLAVRIGTYLWSAVLTLGALLTALGAGRLVAALAAPGGPHGRRRASLALSLALGFVALSLVVAGLGFASLMAHAPLRAVAVAALILGLLELRDRRRELADALPVFRELPVSTVATLAFAVAVWIAFTALPDTHEDPLVYHWAAPEYFLRVGRLVDAPWHFQWHNPLGIEMLFGLGLAVGGAPAIKAVNLALVVTILLAAGTLARRLDGRTRGWAAAVLLALSPAFAEQIWIAKSDLGLVAFWTAAMLAPLEWPIGSLGGAAAAGVLAGFCGAVKWTAIFPMAGLGAWLLLRRPGRRGLAVIFVAALLSAGAWPLRNWLTAGNPVIPAMSRWFQVPWWGPEYEKAVHTYARQVTPTGFFQSIYWIIAWKDVFGDPASLGFALAALAPLGLAAFLPPAAGAACAVSVLVFLAMLTERNARFLLPLAALAAAAGEAAILTLRATWPRLGRAVWILLLGLSVAHLGVKAFGTIPPPDWCWVAGQVTNRSLMRTRLTVQEELRNWCAEHLPRDARILLEGDQKRFGFTQPVVSAHVVVVPLPWRWARAAWTPADLAKKWRQAASGTLPTTSFPPASATSCGSRDRPGTTGRSRSTAGSPCAIWPRSTGPRASITSTACTTSFAWTPVPTPPRAPSRSCRGRRRSSPPRTRPRNRRETPRGDS